MDKTSLYVLFNEYVDPYFHCTNPLILSHDNNNEEKDSKYFKDFLEDIDFFRYEVLDRFYDSRNLQASLYQYEILEEEYREDGNYPNIALTVKTSLKSCGFEDIHQKISKSPEKRFSYHNIDVSDTIIGEAARDNGAVDFYDHQQECHHISVLFQKDSLAKSLLKERKLKYDNGYKEINIVSNLKELYEWLSENRLPQRIYVYNPKHGDAYHKAQSLPNGKQAAQLETDKDTTQQLLNKAIGTDTTSALWYYDNDRRKYIYFENQNEIRLAFHAYHLRPGEENYSNIDLEKLKQIESVPKD